MILQRLFGEFVDVIEWTDSSSDTLVWRFERYNNEIKFGAKLTVREGQAAVFVNEGEIADVFTPGMYELKTANLPILSTLQNWQHGFQSPFKAEIYFFNMRRFSDLKWGTRNPVILRDPEFGPVRLRAFGTYEIRVADPALLLKEMVGTDSHFTTDQITDQLRNLIIARFATVLASSGIPVMDLAASYDQLGQFVHGRIAPEFANYGLGLTRLLVENVSLPPEVEQAMDRRSAMGVIGDLSRYTQFQAAEAMRAAAGNPADGGAGTGIGLGLGMAMAKHFAEGTDRPAATAPPPPVPGTPTFYVARDGQPDGPFEMAELRQQRRDGRLTPTTLVWAEGLAGWEEAQSVKDLVSLFGSTPPPLPTR